ncbi:MAG: DUF4153 domain-containing protein [Lachnospiraceae bacterium]
MTDNYQKENRDFLSTVNFPDFPIYETQDRIFAAVYFLLGYGFIYVFTGAGRIEAFSVFTIFYAAVVLLYLKAKHKTPPAESWFWLAVMLAIGIPLAFWTVLYFFQVLALMAVAAYWTLAASGRLLDHRTSQWIFFDSWNALAVVPFRNFSCQVRVLFGSDGRKTEEEIGQKNGLSILLGILLAVPALLVALPLLSSADAGFEQLVGGMVRYIQDHLLQTFLRSILAVPVSFYLFGLMFGGISGRNTDCLQKEKLRAAGQSIRRVPETAVCVALGILCFVYVLFIGIQGNYLFSAFAGHIPQNFTYAEYARRGFFELCKIGAWNLLLLGCAGLFSRVRVDEHRGLSFFTVLLSVLTLILIITAMSKMGMYIDVYGLTVNRILPIVFMLWMVLVFAAIILRQKNDFPMVRICVMAGAVLFCLLCVFPVENWTQMYNTWARVKGLIV